MCYSILMAVETSAHQNNALYHPQIFHFETLIQQFSIILKITRYEQI